MKKQQIEVEGQRITLHVSEVEGGQPLVALHGFGLSGEIFSYLEPHLTPAGISIYAPDLPGLSSSSDVPVLRGGLRAYARFVHELIHTLALPRALLLGHSMGGRIALAAGLDYPEDFCGLVLLNPGGFYLGEKALFVLSLEPVIRLFHLPLLKPLLRQTPLYQFVATPERRKAVRRYRKAHFGLDFIYSGYRRRLHTLNLPVLLLWGSQDNLLPRQVFHRIQQQLPHVEARLIHHAGHFPAREQPEATAAAILAFSRKYCTATRQPPD